jgi:hypothetical protein
MKHEIKYCNSNGEHECNARPRGITGIFRRFMVQKRPRLSFVQCNKLHNGTGVCISTILQFWILHSFNGDNGGCGLQFECTKKVLWHFSTGIERRNNLKR